MGNTGKRKGKDDFRVSDLNKFKDDGNIYFRYRTNTEEDLGRKIKIESI